MGAMVFILCVTDIWPPLPPRHPILIQIYALAVARIQTVGSLHQLGMEEDMDLSHEVTLMEHVLWHCEMVYILDNMQRALEQARLDGFMDADNN